MIERKYRIKGTKQTFTLVSLDAISHEQAVQSYEYFFDCKVEEIRKT